ncbi:MAG: hypothetical protein ACPG40_12325 [Alphaproteobacteria bacterium]
MLWLTLVFAVFAVILAVIDPWKAFTELTGLLCLSSLLFLMAFAFLRRGTLSGAPLPVMLWIGLGFGLTLRAFILWAAEAPSPGLGFDLFSGQAVLSGLNPYAYSADELLGGGLRVGEAALEGGRALIAGSPTLAAWLQQISPAQTHTDTPMLALPLLVLAQSLTPDQSLGWFAVLLSSDLLTLGLLFLLLRRLRYAQGWVLLFWLNPIWLTALFLPGAPMILIGPLLLLALWASISERSALTGMLLALAATLNFWLIALLPLLLRSAGRRPLAWRRAAYGLVGFVLVAGLLWIVQALFGAPLHWFGGLTAMGEDSGTQIGRLFIIDASGLVSGLARLATPFWLLALAGLAVLLAWPPLPDQAQRALRLSFLGFMALFLSTQDQPQALLALIVVLPLTRSPVLVLASGFGLLVRVLAELNLSLAGLDPSLLARLSLGIVIGVLFGATWVASIRRNQALE